MRFRKIQWGIWWWLGKLRSQGAYFEENWGILFLCTLFLVFCVFFNKCLYFSYYMAGYFLERPHVHVWFHLLFLFIFSSGRHTPALSSSVLAETAPHLLVWDSVNLSSNQDVLFGHKYSVLTHKGTMPRLCDTPSVVHNIDQKHMKQGLLPRRKGQ